MTKFLSTLILIISLIACFNMEQGVERSLSSILAVLTVIGLQVVDINRKIK